LCNAHIDNELNKSKNEHDNLQEPLDSLKRHVISESILGLFTIKFSEQIEFTMRRWAAISENLSPMKEIPIKITKGMDDLFFSIRIADPVKYDHESKKRQGNIKDYIFSARCKKLIKSLLFVNTSVLVYHNSGDRNYKHELDSHNHLINYWLFNEIFDPGTGRLPIVGDVEKIEGKTFGECQKLLIYYLSKSTHSHSALEEALQIIVYYYEEFQLHIVASLQSIENNWTRSLRKLVQDGIKSNLIINKTVKSVDDNFEKVGGLNVMPFEKFPELLKPRRWQKDITVSFDKEEKCILRRFNELSIPCNHHESVIKKKVDGLPLLVYLTYTSVGIEKFIWISSKTGGVEQRYILQQKLSRIIIILKACHLQLVQFLKEKVPEMNDNFEKEFFFNWINSLLMEPVDKNPPIFGHFGLSGDDHLNNESICSSDFSEHQISLINYFSSSDYAAKTLHLSLSLIYCWYKAQRNRIFMQFFSDESSYWHTMIGILTKKFCNDTVSFSISTFVASLSI
jgi:hypothetical protein